MRCKWRSKSDGEDTGTWNSAREDTRAGEKKKSEEKRRV